MAPFCIPAPCIIPLRTPMFGGPRSIDTNTKIELLCDTYLKHEIFYTLDGTKPQPYVGIVQGSKTYKYSSPFCLPPGKITVKAVAVNAHIHSMSSNVITKCFDVLRVKSSLNSKKKVKRKPSKRSNHDGDEEEHPAQDLEEHQACELISGDRKEIEERIGIQCIKSEKEMDSQEYVLCQVSDNDENNFEKCHKLHSNILPNENKNGQLMEDDQVPEELLIDIEDTVGDGDKQYISGCSDVDFLTDYLHENSSHSEGKNIQTENPSSEPCFIYPLSNPPVCCIKCEMTLQYCSSCQKANSIISKYCIQCGEQLAQICRYCKELNSSIATFCQYCGKKLEAETGDGDTKLDIKIAQTDHGVLVKPELKHASIQRIPVMINKHTQTCQMTESKIAVKKDFSRYEKKKLPTHSPGRGYWHQQLDYICNHLKSHAYNNLEFRKTISEPCLSNFQSASVTKDEKSVAVTIIFTPLITEKSDPSLSEEKESKRSS